MKIGLRIKQLRLRRNLTLNELAKRIGLTTSFLSQLERDFTSPSVTSLEKIAQALHVKIADFFQEGEKRELIIVRKRAGRRIVHKKGKILIETLASGVFNINMQSQLFSLGIGAEITKELIPSQGEKFVMVLKGNIKFFSGKDMFIFEEGDSIYCTYTRSPHKVINIGKTGAKVIYLSFLPG